MGASFRDLAFLKVENIVNGRMEYFRQKGGQNYSIKITQGLKDILSTYLQEKESDDYILDIVKPDLGKIQFENIKMNTEKITYNIEGDPRVFEIELTPHFSKEIFQKKAGVERSKFLNNTVMIDQVKRQRKRIKNSLKRFNASLREIAKLGKIESDITSYVARHSFATVAKFKGVPVEVISQALGHTNVQTTEIYLSDFSDDVMDSYLENIVEE